MRIVKALVFSVLFPLVVAALPGDQQIWEHLYRGEYDLAHKQILCRQCDNFDDKMMTCLMVAYSYHKTNEDKKINCIWDIIEYYIKFEIEEKQLR